jgi:hypothetical protein
MTHRTSFRQTLDEIPSDAGTFEVVAAAEGAYVDQAGRMHVEMEAFLRPVRLSELESYLAADWLPAAVVVEEQVPEERATDVARELFLAWSCRVRAAIALHRDLAASPV